MSRGASEDAYIGTGGIAGEGLGREVPLNCLKKPAFLSGCAWKYQKAEPDPKKLNMVNLNILTHSSFHY